MEKYLLKRGLTRLPIDGVREIQREGLPPLRRSETVVFQAGVPVETDLDFGPWVTDGTLIRLRKDNEAPRVPRPSPAVEPVTPKVMTPMPAFVQVETTVEADEEDSDPDADTAEARDPAPQSSGRGSRRRSR